MPHWENCTSHFSLPSLLTYSPKLVAELSFLDILMSHLTNDTSPCPVSGSVPFNLGRQLHNVSRRQGLSDAFVRASILGVANT